MENITVELINLKRLSQGGRENLQNKLQQYSDEELLRSLEYIESSKDENDEFIGEVLLSELILVRGLITNKITVDSFISYKKFGAKLSKYSSLLTSTIRKEQKDKKLANTLSNEPLLHEIMKGKTIREYTRENNLFNWDKADVQYYGNGVDLLIIVVDTNNVIQTHNIYSLSAGVSEVNTRAKELCTNTILHTYVNGVVSEIPRTICEDTVLLIVEDKFMRDNTYQLVNRADSKPRINLDGGLLHDIDNSLMQDGQSHEVIITMKPKGLKLVDDKDMSIGDVLGSFTDMTSERDKGADAPHHPTTGTEYEMVNISGINLPKYIVGRINSEVTGIYSTLSSVFKTGSEQLISNASKVRSTSVQELYQEINIIIKDTISDIDKEVTVVHDMPEYSFSTNTIVNTLCDKVKGRIISYIGKGEYNNYSGDISEYIRVEILGMLDNLPNSKIMFRKLLDDLYKTKDFTEYKGDKSHITNMSKEGKLKLSNFLVKGEELNIIGTDILNSQDIQKRLIISERNNKVASIPVFGILFTLDREMYFYRDNKTICITGIKYEFFEMLLDRGYTTSLITADRQSYDSIVNYCHKYNKDKDSLNICNTYSYFNKVFGIKSFSKEFTFDGRVGGTLIKDLFTDRKDNERTIIR